MKRAPGKSVFLKTCIITTGTANCHILSSQEDKAWLRHITKKWGSGALSPSLEVPAAALALPARPRAKK